MLSQGVVTALLLLLGTALQGLAQSQVGHAVTGAPVSQQPGVGAPVRRSINDLQATGGPQWYVWRTLGLGRIDRLLDRDLYILALASLQLDSDEEQLGYFQVSGTIHGTGVESAC